MAQSRNIPCKYYVYEGECERGKDGIFNKTCQKCRMYTPVEHKKAFKSRDIRRLKRKEYEEQLEREMDEWINEDDHD